MDAIPHMVNSTLRRMEKDRILHLSDIVDKYARGLLNQLPDDQFTGIDVILKLGQ